MGAKLSSARRPSAAADVARFTTPASSGTTADAHAASDVRAAPITPKRSPSPVLAVLAELLPASSPCPEGLGSAELVRFRWALPTSSGPRRFGMSINSMVDFSSMRSAITLKRREKGPFVCAGPEPTLMHLRKEFRSSDKRAMAWSTAPTFRSQLWTGRKSPPSRKTRKICVHHASTVSRYFCHSSSNRPQRRQNSDSSPAGAPDVLADSGKVQITSSAVIPSPWTSRRVWYWLQKSLCFTR
mmetsp:Transcript_52742/g.140723  ORF Transcript_52742/g.140723 Transcript_52742/m.140723 type:complete len:242 (-) Transcript_52742:1937-2662(-)